MCELVNTIRDISAQDADRDEINGTTFHLLENANLISEEVTWATSRARREKVLTLLHCPHRKERVAESVRIACHMLNELVCLTSKWQ